MNSGTELTCQGKVDASAEISKLEKKADITKSNKDKLLKTMNQANYETTVREEVRKGNVEKVSDRCRIHTKLYPSKRVVADSIDGKGRRRAGSYPIGY